MDPAASLVLRLQLSFRDSAQELSQIRKFTLGKLIAQVARFVMSSKGNAGEIEKYR